MLLAVIGYLLNDVDTSQERALATAVDREMRDALLDPMAPAADTAPLPEFEPDAEPGLELPGEGSSPYPYQPLPAAGRPGTDIPEWLHNALAHTTTCHTLDRDDTLVAFVRVPRPDTMLDCPLAWSSHARPAGRGVIVSVAFDDDGEAFEADLRFAFDERYDLRHAASLVRQDLLRIDLLALDGRGRLRIIGTREAVLPPVVAMGIREALSDFGDQVGEG